jgi:predicted DNA-binding transcriptional regulator YafY
VVGCGKVAGRSSGAEGEGAVEVHLEIAPEEASRRVPAALGTLDTVPDGVALRCNASDLAWLARCPIGFGCPFTLPQPPELVAALEQLAVRIARAVERANPRAAKPAPALRGSL